MNVCQWNPFFLSSLIFKKIIMKLKILTTHLHIPILSQWKKKSRLIEKIKKTSKRYKNPIWIACVHKTIFSEMFWAFFSLHEMNGIFVCYFFFHFGFISFCYVFCSLAAKWYSSYLGQTHIFDHFLWYKL